MEVEKDNPIRVSLGVSQNNVEKCAFVRPPCKDAGSLPELARFLLDMLQGDLSDRRPYSFVSATSYGFSSDDQSVEEESYKPSVLGLVRQGAVDASQPDMFLTNFRSKLMKNMGALQYEEYVWIFRTPNPTIPSLSLSSLPLTLYASILATALIFIIPKYFARKTDYAMNLQRFFDNSKVCLLLFYGIFLKLVGNDFVVLFGNMRSQPQGFRNSKDVIESLREKSHTAVTTGGIYHSSIIDPKEFGGILFEEMVQINRINPGHIAKSTVDAMEMVLHSQDIDFVLVTWGGHLARLRSQYCGFSFIRDDLFGRLMTTLYYSDNASFAFRELVDSEREVFAQAIEYLNLRYFPQRVCEPYSAVDTKIGPLKLSQVSIVFVLFGATTGLTVIWFIGEIVIGYQLNRKFSSSNELRFSPIETTGMMY